MKKINAIARLAVICGVFVLSLMASAPPTVLAASEIDPVQKEKDLATMGIFASCAGFYEVAINMDLIPAKAAEQNQDTFQSALKKLGATYMKKPEFANYYTEQVTARANIVAALVVNNREKIVPKIKENLAICEDKYLDDAAKR